MLQAKFQYKASFLQRSASVASLVAWKDRFDKISVKKQASFVSYTSGSDDDSEDWTPTEAPLNDDPPSYPEVTAPEEDCAVAGCSKIKLAACTQDFTALENYFKKKLSIKRSPSTKQTCEDARRMRESVYNWINELPEGNNLEEFLEAYGIPVDGVDMEDFKLRLKAFLDERLSGVNLDAPPPPPPMPEEMPKLHRQKQLKILEELAHEDNLEKWLESLDVPFFRPIPETKDEIRKYLKLKPEEPLVLPPQVVVNPDIVPNTAAYVPKWQELVEKMRDLKNEDELDKWLENLEVPCNVPTAKVKAEIKKFFMHETFDTFPGKSPIFQEKNLARDLWEKFEDAGLLKQVALIAGTTAALGVLAVVSTTLLSFAMPAAFVAGTPYFTEVFAQYFLQRQEVCFNLLNFHAQNAKPLSTAWAKQYILWKYC